MGIQYALNGIKRQMQGACSGGLWSAGAAAGTFVSAPRRSKRTRSRAFLQRLLFFVLLPRPLPSPVFITAHPEPACLLLLCAEALLLPQASGSGDGGGELSPASIWPHPCSCGVEHLCMEGYRGEGMSHFPIPLKLSPASLIYIKLKFLNKQSIHLGANSTILTRKPLLFISEMFQFARKCCEVPKTEPSTQ